ncbi:MAG TPA: hypothetical protein VHK88_07170 [Aquihabitans sp.]|jgi:hypothetical protein|nr:hypothetical protein [Aquihabitans sp.]
MSRRRRAWLAAPVAALLLVSACSAGGDDEADDATTTTAAEGGGGGGEETTTTEAEEETTTTAEVSDDPDQALADAVDATLAAESFVVDSEANLQVGDQEFQITSQGGIDYSGPVADVAIGIDQDGQSGGLEVRSDATNVWVRAEGSAAASFDIPEETPWVEGEASRLTESENFDQADLIGVLLALRAAEGTEAGDTEEIDGVEATQYTTTVDYDAAVEAAGEDADAFENALSLTADGPVSLAIQAWVGDDGIVRRFELEIDAGSAPLGGDYRVELSGVGEEVEAPEPPDDAEVLRGPEAEELLDQLIS